MIFLLVLVISGIIGALIAQSKNKNVGLWFVICFFFSLIGILILLFSKADESQEKKLATAIAATNREWAQKLPRVASNVEFATQAYDKKKWNTLVEIDSDIAAAVQQIRPLGERYVIQFAEKYLTLNDKSYLQNIVERILLDAKKESALLSDRLVAETMKNRQKITDARNQYLEYTTAKIEAIRANSGLDPHSGKRVEAAAIYEGAIPSMHGALLLTFADGSIELRTQNSMTMYHNLKDFDFREGRKALF
jgi:hypothetical protein